MEARASLGRTGVSKGLIALTAVSVTLGLAVMTATLGKNVGSSSATQTHAVVKAQAPDYAQGQRGGVKFLDDNLPTAGSTAAPRVPQPRGGHGPIE